MNKQAPELSPEARRIILEARGVDDPTAEDEARVKARWLASVAAVAGVSSLTEAARAAGGIGWGLKAAGAALVLAAGAIGLYVAVPPERTAETGQAEAPRPAWTGTTHARFEKTPSGQHAGGTKAGDGIAPAVPPEVPAAPVIPPPQVPTTDAVAAAPVPSPVAAASPPAASPPAGLPPVVPSVAEPSAGDRAVAAVENPTPSAAGREAPRAARRVAPRAAARPRMVDAPIGAASPVQPSETSGQLGEELALLSEVRGSVQEGAPVRALELLGRYQTRFGRPILGMEADALRVDALCKSGQRDAARASARAFQHDWPGSPLERRVSAACP